MKTHARYAYALTLALAPACGDDTNANDDEIDAGMSTSDSSSGSTSGTPPSTDVSSTGSASSTADTGAGSSSADDSSTGPDPFADCSRSVIEEDYAVIDQLGVPGATRWYGPGADEDGNLVDDGESEFVVSVTYLALSPNADFDLLNQLNVANSMALYSNPGMVATQLGGSMVCGSLRTFTVWESQAALMEFVASEAHLQSVGAFPALSRGGSTLSVWDEPVTASEITLESAMARIADATPYD